MLFETILWRIHKKDKVFYDTVEIVVSVEQCVIY